jgi:hypothetical protein
MDTVSRRHGIAVCAGLAAAGVLAFYCLGGPASAAPTVSLSLRELVDEAMSAEVDGRNQDRLRWTEQAIAQSPDHAPAHWLRGEVLVKNRWVKIDDVPRVTARDKNRELYEHIRPGYEDTAANQVRLGQWCAQRQLKDEARAHFTRAIQIDPDHAEARRQLGYKRIGESWYTGPEYRRIRLRQQQLNSYFALWRPKVEKIRQGLAGPASQRDKARQELLAIDTPAAIPALERTLARAGGKEAALAAAALGGIRGQEASLALARLAVSSQWSEARQEAVKQLRSRPLLEFVPTLLAMMVGPTEVSSDIVFRKDGTPVLRQTYAKESQTSREENVVETTFADPLIAGRDQREVADLIRSRFGVTTGTQAPEWNDPLARSLNEAVATVLSQVTDRKFTIDGRPWWKWWDDHNDTRYGDKPVNRTYRQETSRVSHSCFAAGTLVWTIDGPRPVEKISVGDRVLSQSVDSGELSYKPVLRTTAGPARELVALKVGEEVFHCTGGHLFWVPGGGWVQARNLDGFARLHAISGATPVESVEPAAKEKTYNLVVADFNTYFVGQEKLLVHDVTLPSPTTTDVPGLRTP